MCSGVAVNDSIRSRPSTCLPYGFGFINAPRLHARRHGRTWQDVFQRRSSPHSMRSEFKALVTLALPVVLAEIGWMSMGLVDTLMVGRLGAAAIGATGMGSGVYFAIAIFGMGLMLGVD